MLIDIKGRWQQFKETLKKVNDALKESGKKVKESMESAQKGLEASGVSGDRLGKFKELTASLTPLAIAGMAVGAVFKAVTATMEYFAQAMRNAIDLAKANAAEADRVAAANDKRRASETEAARKLEELNAQERLSNSQRQEVISIVDRLNRAYDGLGITIDGATGKVKNLDESLVALAQRQQQTQLADLNRQLRNYQQLRTQLQDTVNSTSGSMWNPYTWLKMGLWGNDAGNAAGQLAEVDEKIRQQQLKLNEIQHTDPAQEIKEQQDKKQQAELDHFLQQQQAAAEAEAEKQKKAAEETERFLQQQQAAAEAEAERQRKGTENVDKQLSDLDKRLCKQQMIIAGKQRELAITEELEKAEKAARDAGIELTPEQRAAITEKAGTLYDLANPAKTSAPEAAARFIDSYQPRQLSDSLARIGGYNGAQRTEANNQLAYMRKTSNNVETINSNVNRLTAAVTNCKTSTLIAP